MKDFRTYWFSVLFVSLLLLNVSWIAALTYRDRKRGVKISRDFGGLVFLAVFPGTIVAILVMLTYMA